MTSTNDFPIPKIRAVETTPVHQEGRLFILLRDPLRLADQQIIIPQEISPVLALCDGTRNASAISAALAVRYGQSVSPEEIDYLVSALDEAHLLENDRFLEAKDKALSDYIQAPFRQPVLSGISYPSDQDTLRNFLDEYLRTVESTPAITSLRGLVSPHIDYERGGHIYAQVWSAAKDTIQEADLVIILGTDHFGQDNALTLTRQNYATPYGTLPTATSVVDEITQSIDERILFNGQLYHKAEHSVELAATWLHHIREGKSCEILPVLCGSFERFIQGETHPEDDPLLQRFIDALNSAIKNRSAVIVAAADLAHVGPAFGGRPLDLMGRAHLKAADQELMDWMCAGDAEGFFKAIHAIEDRNNVCGVPPIYLTLQLLSPVEGEFVAYDLCPADQQGTSVVSICGMLFQ
jgi:AmmeMemoRadiSam system protein B